MTKVIGAVKEIKRASPHFVIIQVAHLDRITAVAHHINSTPRGDAEDIIDHALFLVTIKIELLKNLIYTICSGTFHTPAERFHASG